MGRARSQLECLLVFGIYLHLYTGCQSSVTLAASICWCACKQSSWQMCEGCQRHLPGASLGRRAFPPRMACVHSLPGIAQLGELVFGTPACGTLSRRNCEEEGLCSARLCSFMLFLCPAHSRKRFPWTKRGCKGCMCPVSPPSCHLVHPVKH